MSAERTGGLRARIAVEAARLMYEEGVKQYFTAKRIACKRLLGRVGGRRMRYRPSDLPSNGEIRDALLLLADLAEGAARGRRLFAMRVVALEAMRALEPFSPRLIGSVSTGHVRKGSDVDLHVFTDDPDALLAHLRALGWVFETERVSILKHGEIREYLHAHVADVVPVELTVYEPRELRMRPRSSTDGKPIVRLKPAALEALLAAEHPDEWRAYLRDGTVPELEALAAEDEGGAPGEWSTDVVGGDGEEGEGGEGEAVELLAPEPCDGEDPDELYDPLPGFEDV
jgi:hypothetical protein